MDKLYNYIPGVENKYVKPQFYFIIINQFIINTILLLYIQ